MSFAPADSPAITSSLPLTSPPPVAVDISTPPLPLTAPFASPPAPPSAPPAQSPNNVVAVPPSIVYPPPTPSLVPPVSPTPPAVSSEIAPVSSPAPLVPPAVTSPQHSVLPVVTSPPPRVLLPVTSPPPPLVALPPPLVSLPPPATISPKPIISPSPPANDLLPPTVSSPPPLALSPPSPFTTPLVPESPSPLPPATPLPFPTRPSASAPLALATPSLPSPSKPSNLFLQPALPPPLFSPSSSSENGSLPAAVQVQTPLVSNQQHVSTWLITGCILGGIVLLAVLVLCLVLCIWSKARKKKGDVPMKDCLGAKVLQQGNHIIRMPSDPSLPPPPPPPMSRNRGPGSMNSRFKNPSPPPGPEFGLSSGNFTYDQLIVATNGFSEANLLGQGGFGYVHKGVLMDGKEVAVKQLKTGSSQGDREFQAEVETVSRVHHKHLVSLVGYCITGAERLLVYDFVPNKTLEFHLHGTGQPVMDWATRIKIALGSAKGISYLHEDCNPTIIHRDIKASNILLDFGFEAKVSDFGLARFFSDANTHVTHISTQVVGTFGYLAPEYASSGKVTDKSDVYSYGVVLLELITGRPPISTIEAFRNEGLVDWAKPLLSQALENDYFDELVDPRLLGNYNYEEMSRMAACAAACVRHSAWLRPKMSQIVHALEGHGSVTDLDEGSRTRKSALYSSSGSSNYDAYQYKENSKSLNGTLDSQEYGISMRSGSTSEYGLNPSVSSSEFQLIS